MANIPINPKIWFEALDGSIKSLYGGVFNVKGAGPLEKTLGQLLVSNFTLWGYEDEARRKDVPDSAIADLKRKIDGENQTRNDLIDNIDAILQEEIANTLKSINPSLPLNSETPGSVFDRLSILALRAHNLKKEISRTDAGKTHIDRCEKMLKKVEERSRDLVECLRDLLDDYYSGRKRLKSYKQHKLYNDPELNPSLRK